MIGILIITAHVAIAASVTAHVLLRKDDVRAALGWTAIAWLSPLFGAALYYAFGINRVTRRALRLDRSGLGDGTSDRAIALPGVSANVVGLAEIGRRVTGTPLAPGNRISILEGGDEAYPVMLAAIRQARQSIVLASYIFRDDKAGRSFTDALTEAHGRGVAVRVLLDSIGSGYILPLALRRLRAGGVPVARFLHVWMPWRMPFLNMRNHKKILVVDGRIGFTGGMNIGAENSARLRHAEAIDDVHLQIEGPVVEQLFESFAQDWSFTTGEVLDQDIWRSPAGAVGPVLARAIPSGPDSDIYKLETILGAAFAQARSRVRIVTPYFLPDQRLRFAMAQAVLRGVQVEILIPERCDHVYLDWAMRAHLRFFDEIRSNVYFGYRRFDHTKLMTMDGEWCLVGSSNWDARSLRLNFEFDLECYDTALVSAIDALIDRKMSQGRRLASHELDVAPKLAKLRDAASRLLLPYF